MSLSKVNSSWYRTSWYIMVPVCREVLEAGAIVVQSSMPLWYYLLAERCLRRVFCWALKCSMAALRAE